MNKKLLRLKIQSPYDKINNCIRRKKGVKEIERKAKTLIKQRFSDR